jgi:hypothetical protein
MLWRSFDYERRIREQMHFQQFATGATLGPMDS